MTTIQIDGVDGVFEFVQDIGFVEPGLGWVIRDADGKLWRLVRTPDGRLLIDTLEHRRTAHD